MPRWRSPRLAAAATAAWASLLIAAETTNAQVSVSTYRYRDGAGYVFMGKPVASPAALPAMRSVQLVRNGTVVVSSPAGRFSYGSIEVDPLLAGDVINLIDDGVIVASHTYDGLPAIGADACAGNTQFTATLTAGHTVFRAGAYALGQNYASGNPATWTTVSPVSVRLRNPLGTGDTPFVATTGVTAGVTVYSETRGAVAASCPTAPPTAEILPPPAFGTRATARVLSGRVLIRRPGGKFEELDGSESIPVGSIVDTRKGSVEITVARPKSTKTDAVKAGDGQFKLIQQGGARYVTELTLRGASFVGCPRPRRASAAAADNKKKVRRKLWTEGNGRFRTGGRYGSATVRGTRWETLDRCDGTLVKVRDGSVSVRDFARRRTVVVRAGRSYLARARR